MRKKTLIICFCLTLFLGIALGAQAESVIQEVKAYINHDIRLTLNGEDWSPKDPDGVPQSPLIYNGSTYLPLRSVAAVTGAAVDWDPDTKTVSIATYEARDEAAHGEPYKDAAKYGEVEYSLVNKTIRQLSDIFLLKRSGNTLSFPLNKKADNRNSAFYIGYSLYGAAKRVTGQLAAASSVDAVVHVEIKDFADGKLLYESPLLHTGGEPVVFSVETAGVHELIIEAYTLSNPAEEIMVVVRNLSVVADKSIPESTFDITRQPRLIP